MGVLRPADVGVLGLGVMHPGGAPGTANAAERMVFAALERWLPEGSECWFQARLPGRHGRLSFEADFLLLDESGLLVIEVKGWRAASITGADDSRVLFRNGAANQHPLLQAYRYRTALMALLRTAGVEGVPIRVGAALPFISEDDLRSAPWAESFPRERVLLRDDLGAELASRLSAIPPRPVEPLGPRQFRTVRNMLTSAPAAPLPGAEQGRLL